MKNAGSGMIISIGSLLSISGSPVLPAYGASKGEVLQLTQSLAVAWASDNIQVNGILPGWILTDLAIIGENIYPGSAKDLSLIRPRVALDTL